MSMPPLWVVTAIFNPCRYRSRIDLYRRFEKYVRDSGAGLLTVELAFGERPFEVTEPGDPLDLQLRTRDELWHKEKLLNLGIQRLPADWKYVAWIDADVIFARPDWVKETVHLLQHYPVIQMFSQAADLGPNYEQLHLHTGCIYAHDCGLDCRSGNYSKYHPGYAWAARRDAIDGMGGFFDVSILGSADRFMALSMLGQKATAPGISPSFNRHMDSWRRRCQRVIRGNVGHMPGLLLHYWHGKKVDRRYKDRWKILVEHSYCPDSDLQLDSQGLYTLTDRCPGLRYDMRQYFRARNEDSVDV